MASLNSQQLDKIQSLENDLGYLLLALEPKYNVADLDADAVEKVKKLEEELGIVLLAYQS
jgi:hypothetical protein